MVMLSKRELEQMNEAIQNRSNYEHQVILLRSEFDTIWLNTLALYNERDNMKAGIEKLGEKWIKGCKGTIQEQYLINLFIRDLASIGKEE